MIVNPILPGGWTTEDLGNSQLLISAPQGRITCSVTIDLRARGWRGGITRTGLLESRDRRYSGRGWRQRLIDDAVKYLQEVIK